jgi:hypothetical protein
MTTTTGPGPAYLAVLDTSGPEFMAVGPTPEVARANVRAALRAHGEQIGVPRFGSGIPDDDVHLIDLRAAAAWRDRERLPLPPERDPHPQP